MAASPQRDMSYDLDSVFSTRNQGQLISAKPVQTKMVRTPGLTQVSGDMMPGMGDEAPGVMSFQMNWGTLLIGAGLCFVVMRALKKG